MVYENLNMVLTRIKFKPFDTRVLKVFESHCIDM